MSDVQEAYAEVLFRNSGSEAERVARLLVNESLPKEVCGVWWTPRSEGTVEGRSTLRIYFVEGQKVTMDTVIGMAFRLSGEETGMEFVRDALVD